MAERINLTTGPVKIETDITLCFKETPVSHRSLACEEVIEAIRTKLSVALHTKDVILMNGSGTLANEAMIAQIAQLHKKGLVLANGEFGERLIKQCNRYDLSFVVLQKEWGAHFPISEIEKYIETQKPSWILCCHHETSTGVLNDLPALSELCREHKISLYLDCISSIGNIPVDLSSVAMATGSSGKGLAAYAGIALVFSNQKIHSTPKLPSYLDLEYYVQCHYLPFTINSNLLFALNKAIDKTMIPEHWKVNAFLSRYLKKQLLEAGYEFLNQRPESESFVFTIQANNQNSFEIGEKLKESGLQISYESNYLQTKGLFQLSLMGTHSLKELDSALEKMNALFVINAERF